MAASRARDYRFGLLVWWMMLAVLQLCNPSSVRADNTTVLAYSDLVREVDAGHVQTAFVQGHIVSGQLKNDRSFQSYVPTDTAFIVQHLIEKGAGVIGRAEESDANPLLHYLLTWLPSLLFWVVAFRFVGVRVRYGQDRVTARRITALEARLQRVEGVPK